MKIRTYWPSTGRPAEMLDIGDQVGEYGFLRLTLSFDGRNGRSLELSAIDAQQLVDHLTRVFSLEKKA